MSELELHVSTRLSKVLPALTDEQRKQLAANIKADGKIQDPILYWFDGKQNVVVDGMHRLPIAKELGFAYQSEPINLSDTCSYEDVEIWMWEHQAGRRNLSREAIGKWYNRIKRKDKGHGDQKIGVSNDTPVSTSGGEASKVSNDTLLNAAQRIAEKTGVSESTVKRDGAFVEALEQCVSAVQKGVETGAIKPTAAEIGLLAKLAPEDQGSIASDLRKGQAASVKESMKLRGIRIPGKKKKPKPPKLLDKKGYYKEWTQTIGPLMRTLDKIAHGVDEFHGPSHRAILGQLEACTEEMGEWMGVVKKDD